MQREVKIGMSVIYQLGEGEPPVGHNSQREQPALVCAVRRESNEIDVVIFPFGYHSFHYRGMVPKGNKESTAPCWFFSEES